MRRTQEEAPTRYGEAYVSALRQHVASVKQAVVEIEEQIAALEGMVEEATQSRDPPEPRGPTPRAAVPPGIPVHLLGPTAQEQEEAPAQDAKRARYRALRDGGFVAVGLDESAYETFRGWQKPALVLIAIAVVASLIIWPVPFLIAFNAAATVCYFAIIAFRFYTIQRGERKAKTVLDIADDDVRAVDDATLPVYTILSPLYQEAETVVQFLRAMAQMDYPFEKLDIRVLLEEDDTETRTAALREKARMGNPEAIQIIVVPDALPKTKPKACNYGLSRRRGEYLVIYDAEDIPEPDQLKKASIAFAQRAGRVGLHPGETELLQPPSRTCSPAGSRPSTASGSTSSCPASTPRTRRSRSAARSNHFIIERLRALGALGPVQRHGGRGPRHPARQRAATARR